MGILHEESLGQVRPQEGSAAPEPNAPIAGKPSSGEDAKSGGLDSSRYGGELGPAGVILPEDLTRKVDFEKGGGVVPAVIQDAATGQVLMVGYMNRESLMETLASGRTVFFSRSRNRLWRKGEESGHVQLVRAIYLDCDADTLLIEVEQVGGAACHEGYVSCFFRQLTHEGLKVVGKKVFDPVSVYGKKA